MMDEPAQQPCSIFVCLTVLGVSQNFDRELPQNQRWFLMKLRRNGCLHCVFSIIRLVGD